MLIKRNKNTNIICMVIKNCHKVINNKAKAPFSGAFKNTDNNVTACRNYRGQGA